MEMGISQPGQNETPSAVPETTETSSTLLIEGLSPLAVHVWRTKTSNALHP